MSDRSFLQTPGRSIGRSASLQRALGTHSVSSSQPSVLSPGASAPRIPDQQFHWVGTCATFLIWSLLQEIICGSLRVTLVVALAVFAPKF